MKPQQRERWTFHLHQMILAISKIEDYIAGYTQSQFLSDAKTLDAVIRNLEIIGEATHHVPNKVRNHYSAVPWMELRHMRNFLAHEYFDVDALMVWETVVKDLQGLKKSLERLYSDVC